MDNKYKVTFAGKEMEYKTGSMVSLDITEYVLMTGAYYTFSIDDENVTLTRNVSDMPYTLDFIMPGHDVNILLEEHSAGLPIDHQQPFMNISFEK